MSDVLARRYRAVLRAYPRSYRAGRGDELLGTLLDTASPQQRWPSVHEAASIVAEGLRARLDAGTRRPPRAVWLDGLRVAVVLLLAYAHAEVMGDVVWRAVSARSDIVLLLLALLSILVVLRGRPVAALLLASAWLALQVWTHTVSWHLVTAVLILALLAFWLRPVWQARSVSWLIVVPVMIAVQHGPWIVAGPVYLHPHTNVAIIVAAVACAVGALLDPRVPIIAASMLVAEILRTIMWFASAGDTPSSVVALRVDLRSWPWVLVLAATASILVLIGHLRMRRLTSL